MSTVLGIETSCDETSAAVVTEDLSVLSNVVLSQDEIHAPYGGIVPELASRQHIRSITYVVSEALERAGVGMEQIDALGVTQGPGLIGSLLVGLSFAKGLAYTRNLPLIPVDHLESHIHSVFIENPEIEHPMLALLVSGGHSSLFFLEAPLQYRQLAKTRDDAAGEVLDKIAKFLDLGYPGGPVIDRLAAEGDGTRFEFSRPRMSDGSLDFSFSGFKTAALNLIKKQQLTRDHPDFLDFLASFESAVIKALLGNLERALIDLNPRSLVLCGGVARNSKLREQFLAAARQRGIPGYVPAPELCTDNAAMVAALAHALWRKGLQVPLDLELNAYPRR
jgi:N6-L-threonylcarbamoyladenine synthase